MAPPPTSTISRVITVILKIVMFALLLASLVILVTDTATLPVLNVLMEMEIHFDDFYTYRYVLASIVVGLVYSLLQTGFSLYHLATGNRLIGGDGAFVFDFYGDQVISYVVATGSAAGFGATKDLKALADAYNLDLDDYFDKAYASASLLLLAFFCAAILSVFSSYALPKVVN